ncbi:MAG: phospholipase/carboxylesterase family protein [Proteobacteria bacterium]|nr:phospholipase/carboxylesterase family protein [Pseudomonadota bacterium]
MHFDYLLRRPLTPPTHRPPLLVLLHGKGANEDDLFTLAKHFDPRFMVISLRAPHEMAPGYYRWYERAETAQGLVFDEAEIEASRTWLIQAINDAVMGLGADPHQVHLLGFGQGGAMALALALTAPRHLRSVVSIAGRLLAASAPFAAPAEAMDHLTLLIQHGTLDERVPHAESVAACALFAELSVKQGFKEYAASHTISPAMLKDALDFLRVQLDTAQGKTH